MQVIVIYNFGQSQKPFHSQNPPNKANLGEANNPLLPEEIEVFIPMSQSPSAVATREDMKPENFCLLIEIVYCVVFLRY